MEDSPEPKDEPTTAQEPETPVVDVETNVAPEAVVTFFATITTFNKAAYADQRQEGGRWAPAFPETTLEKQEAYVARMIERDRELNLG